MSQYARMHRDTRGFRPVLATFSVTCWPSVSAQSAGAMAANPVRQVGKEAAVTGRGRIAPRWPWAALPAETAGRCSHPGRRGALARAQCPGGWRIGYRRVVQLLVDVDENGVVFDPAGVDRDRATGKHANRLARGQVVA